MRKVDYLWRWLMVVEVDQSWKLLSKTFNVALKKDYKKVNDVWSKIYKADSLADEYTLTQTNEVSGISLPNLKLV